MKIDMNSFINSIKEQTPNDYSTATTTSPYKTLYPFAEGIYKVRIFWNASGGCVQNRIYRHKTDDKKNIACLMNYGKDCPVCNAVKEVENALGKDTGVRRRFGYVERGICFAQVVDAPKTVFDDGKISRGDIVLLMYPKTVLNGINTILQQAIDANRIDDVISKNVGYVITIEHTKSNPAYAVNISLETYQSFNSDSEFDGKISALPNIREQIIPTEITDEVYNSARTLAESVKAEFLNSTVVNPNSYGNAQEQSKFENVGTYKEIVDDDELPFESPAVANSNTQTAGSTTVAVSDGPECFGCYKAGTKKCLLCPKEIECCEASK